MKFNSLFKYLLSMVIIFVCLICYSIWANYHLTSEIGKFKHKCKQMDETKLVEVKVFYDIVPNNQNIRQLNLAINDSVAEFIEHSKNKRENESGFVKNKHQSPNYRLSINENELFIYLEYVTVEEIYQILEFLNVNYSDSLKFEEYSVIRTNFEIKELCDILIID